MNLDLPIVEIEAKTISGAWAKAIRVISEKGVAHVPDYGNPTRRIFAVIHIENVYERQVSAFLPFGKKSVNEYKKELTEDYANWYVTLKPEDKKKFTYCYAKQLYLYGPEQFNSLRSNIKNLRNGSRRHVGVLWENTVHINQYEDQPCFIAYKLEFINEKEVRLIVVFRSWDIFGGMPANLPGIVHGVQLILDDERAGLKIGDLICVGMDAHIYETDMQATENILNATKPCTKCGELHSEFAMIQRDVGPVCLWCMRGK